MTYLMPPWHLPYGYLYLTNVRSLKINAAVASGMLGASRASGQLQSLLVSQANLLWFWTYDLWHLAKNSEDQQKARWKVAFYNRATTFSWPGTLKTLPKHVRMTGLTRANLAGPNPNLASCWCNIKRSHISNPHKFCFECGFLALNLACLGLLHAGTNNRSMGQQMHGVAIMTVYKKPLTIGCLSVPDDLAWLLAIVLARAEIVQADTVSKLTKLCHVNGVGPCYMYWGGSSAIVLKWRSYKAVERTW